MNKQRGKLGLAFGGVALAGVVLGFAVSARLSFTGDVAAAPATSPPAVTAARLDSGPTKKNGPPLPSVGAAATPARDPMSASAPPPVPAAPLPNAPVSFAPLVKQVAPSVVHIDVEGRRGQGLGTGFIISSDGYIATNEHVVGGMQRIRVRMADDRTFAAKLIGTDPKTDVALIKIEPPAGGLPSLELGDSDVLEVGDWVVAIGSPLNLDQTVTAGIVSAKQRRRINPSNRVSQYEDFIQTDASINPGNSGGPLLNMRGEVIGINSAVSAQGQGIGFAIPINMAKKLLPMLRDKGFVERAYIGVHIGAVPDQVAAMRQLPDSRGAHVSLVEPGSPAALAGIVEGDVILEFDGQPIRHADDLPLISQTAGVGRTVDVVVVGDHGSRTVKVTLGRMP
jgi:serine protease Do